MRRHFNLFWTRTVGLLFVVSIVSGAFADGLPSPDEVTVNVIQNNPVSSPGATPDSTKKKIRTS